MRLILLYLLLARSNRSMVNLAVQEQQAQLGQAAMAAQAAAAMLRLIWMDLMLKDITQAAAMVV